MDPFSFFLWAPVVFYFFTKSYCNGVHFYLEAFAYYVVIFGKANLYKIILK